MAPKNLAHVVAAINSLRSRAFLRDTSVRTLTIEVALASNKPIKASPPISIAILHSLEQKSNIIREQKALIQAIGLYVAGLNRVKGKILTTELGAGLVVLEQKERRANYKRLTACIPTEKEIRDISFANPLEAPLPDPWHEEHVAGLRARGDFKIEMSWQ